MLPTVPPVTCGPQPEQDVVLAQIPNCFIPACLLNLPSSLKS